MTVIIPGSRHLEYIAGGDRRSSDIILTSVVYERHAVKDTSTSVTFLITAKVHSAYPCQTRLFYYLHRRIRFLYPVASPGDFPPVDDLHYAHILWRLSVSIVVELRYSSRAWGYPSNIRSLEMKLAKAWVRVVLHADSRGSLWRGIRLNWRGLMTTYVWHA